MPTQPVTSFFVILVVFRKIQASAVTYALSRQDHAIGLDNRWVDLKPISRTAAALPQARHPNGRRKAGISGFHRLPKSQGWEVFHTYSAVLCRFDEHVSAHPVYCSVALKLLA